MRKHVPVDSLHTQSDADARPRTSQSYGEQPNRLMTAFEVAEYVGCHEETVRRAYLRGLLVTAVRRKEPALSSQRCPGLDSSGGANTSLVIDGRSKAMKEDP
jgi:hypothetical protein